MDYDQLPCSVTIPAYASSATIDLKPTNDAVVEGDETAILTLDVTPDGAYRINGTESRTVTIADNEPTVTIEAAAYAAEQGPTAGRFTVRRSGDIDHAVTVPYSVGGSATPGDDYAALPGSVTIPAAAYAADIAIAPMDDIFDERGPGLEEADPIRARSRCRRALVTAAAFGRIRNIPTCRPTFARYRARSKCRHRGRPGLGPQKGRVQNHVQQSIAP